MSVTRNRRQAVAWEAFADALIDEMFKIERERVHRELLRQEALVECTECGWWPHLHARSCGLSVQEGVA